MSVGTGEDTGGPATPTTVSTPVPEAIKVPLSKQIKTLGNRVNLSSWNSNKARWCSTGSLEANRETDRNTSAPLRRAVVWLEARTVSQAL